VKAHGEPTASCALPAAAERARRRHRAHRRRRAHCRRVCACVVCSFLPLIVFEQQPGVAVRKELYRQRGLISAGHVRHPAPPKVSPALATALSEQIARSLPGVDVTKPLPPALFEAI
jgi:hypothetical protein